MLISSLVYLFNLVIMTLLQMRVIGAVTFGEDVPESLPQYRSAQEMPRR